MKTSATGLRFIAAWEGERDTTYLDIAHVATIGIGHALKPGESYPNGITHEEAIALLAGDVASAEAAVNSNIKVTLLQNEYDSLVSFCYNLGGGALAHSALLAKLNAGDRYGASSEFPKWCHAMIGGRLQADPGLLRRRLSEQHLFLTPYEEDVAQRDTEPVPAG